MGLWGGLVVPIAVLAGLNVNAVWGLAQDVSSLLAVPLLDAQKDEEPLDEVDPGVVAEGDSGTEELPKVPVLYPPVVSELTGWIGDGRHFELEEEPRGGKFFSIDATMRSKGLDSVDSSDGTAGDCANGPAAGRLACSFRLCISARDGSEVWGVLVSCFLVVNASSSF